MKLMSLVANGELSGRQVARRYKQSHGKPISYGTLYTTFLHLKAFGWVTMRQDEQDGRVRFLKLSGSGMAALLEAVRYHEDLAESVRVSISKNWKVKRKVMVTQ